MQDFLVKSGFWEFSVKQAGFFRQMRAEVNKKYQWIATNQKLWHMRKSDPKKKIRNIFVFLLHHPECVKELVPFPIYNVVVDFFCLSILLTISTPPSRRPPVIPEKRDKTCPPRDYPLLIQKAGWPAKFETSDNADCNTVYLIYIIAVINDSQRSMTLNIFLPFTEIDNSSR